MYAIYSRILMQKYRSFMVIYIFLCIHLLPVQLQSQLAEGKGKFSGNMINYSVPENFEDYWNQVTPECGQVGIG